MKRKFPILTDKRKIAKDYKNQWYRLNILVRKITPGECKREFSCPFTSFGLHHCRKECKQAHIRKAIEAFIVLMDHGNPWHYFPDGKQPMGLWYKEGFPEHKRLSEKVGFDIYGTYAVTWKQRRAMRKKVRWECKKMREEYNKKCRGNK